MTPSGSLDACRAVWGIAKWTGNAIRFASYLSWQLVRRALERGER
jgi:hypothetical protein